MHSCPFPHAEVDAVADGLPIYLAGGTIMVPTLEVAEAILTQAGLDPVDVRLRMAWARRRMDLLGLTP